MCILVSRCSIEYSGEWTNYYGVFSDDELALKALEDLKVMLSEDEHIPIEEWEDDRFGLGYNYGNGGYSMQAYLEEVEVNKKMF